MRLFLAPMEGVVDYSLRDLLTAIGGFDICVTEFIRVTDHLLPDKVFYRYCPELLHPYNTCSKTRSGSHVRVQLLGGKPEPVANNAEKAALLGASAIDLNFGCPAKTVNKSDGGACLLQSPHRVYDIIHACRSQVPINTPVTAKMRLGYEDRSAYIDNALAAYEAGADELTVHARSKADGYSPPAYWDTLAEIRSQINIPVIANGEIWTVDDYIRCKTESQCDDFMLGRGALSCPDLALQIKAYATKKPYKTMNWSQIATMLQAFFAISCNNHHQKPYPNKYLGNRLKQWLNYLRRCYPEASLLFEEIKRCKDKTVIEAAISHSIDTANRTNNSDVTDFSQLA